MRTFIIADNQDLTRKGIQSLIESASWSEEICYAESSSQLQKQLKESPNAIVLLDYALFDFPSVDYLEVMIQAYKNSFWILFFEDLTLQFLRKVLYNDLINARISVVRKRDREGEIRLTLEKAMSHVVHHSEAIEASLVEEEVPVSKQSKLTRMEKLVLKEIAAGKTTKQIAGEKNISFHTVNTHRKNIFRKIEVNNMQEAIRYAIRAGLLDTSDYYI